MESAREYRLDRARSVESYRNLDSASERILPVLRRCHPSKAPDELCDIVGLARGVGYRLYRRYISNGFDELGAIAMLTRPLTEPFECR